ncbi:MAG: FtsX-like permease family protein [Gemmatimonadaceae bacterium]|jgi:putative ABC transport system permease protein|nr:FtsX-like permease family protein [Gemmatimonadaceae bacterium]
MWPELARAALTRHPLRTWLAVLGVAVSAALLLDMVMLATGMRDSFAELYLKKGFPLRVAPKGTLPFDTEATIGGASALRAEIEGGALIGRVSPVLGLTLHHIEARTAAASTVLGFGLDPRVQGDYELVTGTDMDASPAASPVRVVVNAPLLTRLGKRVGDTLTLAAAYDPQLRTTRGRLVARVVGEVRFLYTPPASPVVAMPLAALQGVHPGGPDRVSLFMVEARDTSRVEEARAWIERTAPRVSAISTTTAMVQVEQRLSYFRQLAFILGSISLAIGFLLVTTLVTVSVNERIGEIAVLRAIGVSKRHVVQQIVTEGAVLSIAGAIGGLALGLATARVLNRILSDFPGLPAAFDFFRFEPRAAWVSLGLLMLAGIAAGVYPAWRAASLPVAQTLREEAVG